MVFPAVFFRRGHRSFWVARSRGFLDQSRARGINSNSAEFAGDGHHPSLVQSRLCNLPQHNDRLHAFSCELVIEIGFQTEFEATEIKLCRHTFEQIPGKLPLFMQATISLRFSHQLRTYMYVLY